MALCLAMLFCCVFTLCVSAAGSADSDYGEITPIEGVSEPTEIDSTSRVVILASDGTYYTFPAYYVLADSNVFTWKQN